jgi:two-component sensor histidine kinase
MASNPSTSRIPLNPVSAIGRLPTGAKILLILSGALLPLALIALFATLQIPRTADQEARAQLRVAASESARSIAIELIGDTTALRTAINALEVDPGNAPACARVRGVFVQQASADVRFAVRDRAGRVLCGERLAPAVDLRPRDGDGPVSARLAADKGVVLAMRSDSGRTEAAVFFPKEFLATVARPSGFPPPYAATLTLGDARLDIATLPYRNTFERRETLTTDMGLSGLALEMSVRSAPITSSLVLAMLLPLIMWASAAVIAFIVVDRLLIRPLRQLRASVANYSAGDIIDPGVIRSLPAQEIRELGDTFRAISRTVALHEADLAAGLIRQTKLTREVHHRVKNNLQVIASLINFHARSAQGEEAVNAYASIQRRVDALAVVHRNHHAEVEDSPGLPLRGILGELAQSIRATAPPASAHLAITLDVAPFLVSQDTATAVAFLVTEIIELGMGCDPNAKMRVSAREGDGADRAIVRVSSPVLTGPVHDALVEQRYGRVMQGLARQLRTTLVHDAQLGAYEVAATVRGRE